MDRKMHSLRVADDNWMDSGRFEELIGLLQQYPCGIGRISLFTAGTHAPLVLPELKERLTVMEQRLRRLRECGFLAGINILATIGHHEEDLDHSFHGDYYSMTNDMGEICRGSFCMGDERYLRDYVRPAYRMLAEAEPDFIWIDDDIRSGHLPIGFGCFCDGCIDNFNREHQTTYTREGLREALDRGDLALRKAWLSHNTDNICRLFRVIGETVREVRPEITLGFMTGERYFEGYDFARMADALSENGTYEIMWRPGGGAYTDYNFDEIINKQEEVGRQNSLLPAYVTISQYEIENFPYQLLKKSPTSTALEAALSMTAGCTGAAFNILPGETGEPLELIRPWLKTIDERMPFYELLAEKIGGKQPVGIGTGWKFDCQAATEGERWTMTYGGEYAGFARELFDFGLPQSYLAENRVVTLVKGACTRTWSEDEMQTLLSGGVYLDGDALEDFNRRGYGAYTGFTRGAEYPVDARESYLPAAINSGIENGIRNCRQAFFHGESREIVPVAKEAVPLARLIDYHGTELASCCLGFYENALGGRICGAGYYPFSWVSDSFKSLQLKRLFVHLSGGRLPSYVETCCRVRNHTFVEGDKTIVTLCNPGNEPIISLRVAIRTKAIEAYVTDQRCLVSRISCDCVDAERDCKDGNYKDGDYKEGGNYRFFTVDKLLPYEMIIIEA